ncbi:TlpA disulfide reductase family protein [Bacillus sp. FJAT-45350]|uniref:TlpA disulfide reductase family protein n=1 Tax=Bacillus sp. FJAT-45350 TaxID=2011014 RepID=UPI001155172E|nr:TlpA disulfide reductase family protein [Bacillus sp. FJAT-45350]
MALDFTLKEIRTNEDVTLSSFKGKSIMLTFWTSWCPDSLQDLQQKNRLYLNMAKDKLVFLTINVTGRERNERDANTFLEGAEYQFPTLVDEGTKVYNQFQCEGVPTTILINEKFEIVRNYNDQTPFIEIVKGLSELI